MSVEIVNPFDSYRAQSGAALDAGKLYIGVANLDPQTNPIAVFYDAALTVAAPQPLATSGGYVWRSGAPARIYTASSEFSIRLLDKNNTQVFYSAVTGGTGDYTAPFTGAISRTQASKNADTVSIKDFGSIADGTYHPLSERFSTLAAAQFAYPSIGITSLSQSIDWAAAQSALNGNAGGLVTATGHYIITDTLLVRAGTTLSGAGQYQYWSKTLTGTIFTTYGAGQPKRWTDIDGTDGDFQPLFVMCGDGCTLENITAITPDDNKWSAAYFVPCVRRTTFKDCYADGRWFEASMYLDATWGDNNTALNSIHPYVDASSMNEFRCMGGVLRGNRSVYLAGTTRDPEDYGGVGQPPWIWSGAGTSDLNFYDVALRPLSNGVTGNSACLKLNAAIDNSAGAGQGIWFHNCFFRASAAAFMFDFDRCNRVTISGYGEAGSTNPTCKASFTSRSTNLLFQGRFIQNQLWYDGEVVLRPNRDNELAPVPLDFGNQGLPGITVMSNGVITIGNFVISGNYIRPQFHNTGRLGRGQADPLDPEDRRDNSFERAYIKEVRAGFGNLLTLQGDAGLEFRPTNTTQRGIWTDDFLSISQNGEDEDFRVSEGGIFARSVNTPVLNADNIDLAISQLSGGAKAYQTEAELIATGAPTPTTQLAYVLNDADPVKNGLYGWTGSAWAKSPYDPLTQSLTAITAEEDARIDADAVINTSLSPILAAQRFDNPTDDFGNKYIFALIDALRIGLGITKDLKMIWNGVTIKSELFTAFDIEQNITDELGNRYALALINRDTQQVAWGVTRKGEMMIGGAKHGGGRLPFAVYDAFGRAAISVTKSGKVYIPNLVGGTGGGGTDVQEAAKRIAADIQMLPVGWYDINHHLWNGQSLSNGTESTPAISTSQPYSNVMITSGVRLAPTDAGYNGAGLVPLVEAVSGSLGETPVSGTVNGLVERIVAAGGTAASRVMLGTASGIGSRRVDQLLEESNFYKIRGHVSEAKRLATAAGKTYAVTSLCFAQGESDIGAGGSGNTSFTDYYRRYLQLMTNTRQVIVDASGQPFMPWVFSYQTSAHQNYNKQILHVPMAQWRASKELRDVVMVVPSYRMPCTAVDNLHLTNEGSWLLGQYFARAMFWTFELGQKWRPLEPIDVTWSSTQIDVKYHVPCKPIQLSTAICTAVTNSGYDIWTAAGTVISDAISSVAVLSDDTVRITLNPAATIPADAVLSYGRSRVGAAATSGTLNNPPCGNLIDSHGSYESVTAPTTGTVYPLTNVGVLFQFRRNLGFH